MRPALVNTLITAVVTSALPFTAMADTPAQTGLAALPPGELRVEIHSPSTATELSSSTGEAVRVEVEGAASTIGGVRHIDMMLVMDTSMSLRKSDPDDYRVAAAVGLVESLSARSDTRIGVIGFSNKSELMQPLTSDRQEAIAALHGLKRTGGTNIADGIRTALAELRRDSRPDSSSLIMLFTDGMSNERNAREATLEAQEQGVPFRRCCWVKI
jgi:Mg-chelatase subunit ChlD